MSTKPQLSFPSQHGCPTIHLRQEANRTTLHLGDNSVLLTQDAKISCSYTASGWGPIWDYSIDIVYNGPAQPPISLWTTNSTDEPLDKTWKQIQTIFRRINDKAECVIVFHKSE